MVNTNENHERSDKMEFYQIQIDGHLDTKWSDWFGGFCIEHKEGITVLTGSVPDQAALHGIFAKIRDLGLIILSVQQVESKIKKDET